MEEKKTAKKSIIPVWFGVACVWFGVHCGPGAASGNQTVAYFIKYGLWSLIIPIFSMGLLGIGLYYAMEFSRRTHATDFKDFGNKIFDPYHKIFANLFEFSFVGTVGLAGGACTVTAASTIQQYFNVPLWVGMAAIILVTIFFSIYGESLVRAVSTGMSIVIFIAIISVVAAGLSRSGGISASFEGRSFGDANGLEALWMGVLYAAFQTTGNFSACIAVVHDMHSRKEVKKSVIAGIIINTVFILLVSIMLLAYPEAIKDSLPNYWVVSHVGMPILQAAYVIIVFFACATTIIGFANAMCGRYSKFIKFGGERTKKLVIVIITVIYAVLFSLLGLNKIVGVGFKYLGYFCVVTLLFPTIIVGAKKMKKMDMAEKANSAE